MLALLVLPGAAHADDRLPDALAGLVWVDRAPDARTDTLHRVDPGGTVTDRPLDYAVNAIGCAPDGSVFGLAASHLGVKLAGGPHLLRVTGTAQVDLGAVLAPGLRYPLAEAYAGTVLNAPLRLVVDSGGVRREVSLGGSRPTVTRSLPLPPLPYVGDWDTEPGTGDLLTV